MLLQLAAGLAAAHRQGVVHRDLKAANLMVDNDDHVWVMDFGLARDFTREPSYSGVVGTPAYWAPEQAHGEPANPASDVYSFGIVAYRVFTGRLPRRHLEKTSFSQVPRRWRPLVRRCMNEQVAHRFANGDQLERAIRQLQRRSTKGWPVAVLVLALAIVAVWWGWSPNSISAPSAPPPAPVVTVTPAVPPVEVVPPVVKVEAVGRSAPPEVPKAERRHRPAGSSKPKVAPTTPDVPLFD